MRDERYIYAFVHIPKTARTTFKYHIVKYFNQKEHLYLGADSVGLWDDKKGASFREADRAVRKKIRSIKHIDKLRVIHGHLVTYGVHKYLPRPVRYFTFVREPVARTISMYNHYREQYETNRSNNTVKVNCDYNLLIDGKVPSFKKWVTQKYNPKGRMNYLTMYQKLILNGFIQQTSKIEEEIENTLKKFWFVGLLENFGRDSLYLYQKLGINAYFINQNVSRKYFKLSKDDEIESEIKKRNKKDLIIYKKAIEKIKSSLKVTMILTRLLGECQKNENYCCL